MLQSMIVMLLIPLDYVFFYVTSFFNFVQIVFVIGWLQDCLWYCQLIQVHGCVFLDFFLSLYHAEEVEWVCFYFCIFLDVTGYYIFYHFTKDVTDNSIWYVFLTFRVCRFDICSSPVIGYLSGLFIHCEWWLWSE